MIRNRIIFATLALFVVLGGCKKLEFIPAEPNAILPLEKGRYWIYEEHFTAELNGSGQTIYLDCTNEVEWEILEKGYLDFSSTDDVRLEMFSMRSKRNSDLVYYLLRPEPNGIVIYDISTENPSPNARSIKDPCYGLANYKQYLIQYPFPSSIDLPQNIAIGCGDGDCVEEMLRSVQSNGPRTLAPEGMTSIAVGADSVDAMKLGDEYWAPSVGLVKIERDYFLAWQNDTTFYHLTWQLKEYGIR